MENSWTRYYPMQGLPVSTTSVCLRFSVFLQSRPTIHCVRPSIVLSTTSRAPEFVNQATSFSVLKKFGPCHRCGRRHDARTCKFKGATCHRCGKQGHIAPVCKSASPPPADRGKKKFNYRASHRRQTGGTKWLETEVELCPTLVCSPRRYSSASYPCQHVFARISV